MKYILPGILVIIFMVSASKAGQPASAYSVAIDTAVYDLDTWQYMDCMFFPSAVSMDATRLPANIYYPGTLYAAFRKKDSTAVDIFSLSGKVGSVNLPPQSRDFNTQGFIYLFSQTIVDADEGWECLRIRPGSDGPFILFDEDGSQLLSDLGFAFYGFDGKDTYVITTQSPGDVYFQPLAWKCWRFRTDVAAAQPGSLQKKTVSFPQPMMAFGPAGKFQISLLPAGGGPTSVRLFDCMGRLVYDRTVEDINKPTTVNISKFDVPKTPFIAKVRDGNGSIARKQIPVR
jgi:hypothetical protein